MRPRAYGIGYHDVSAWLAAHPGWWDSRAVTETISAETGAAHDVGWINSCLGTCVARRLAYRRAAPRYGTRGGYTYHSALIPTASTLVDVP